MTPIERLLEVMATLRDPERGCPWDLEQNFASLVPHTLEEAYEVAEAIEQGTPEEVRDELGDLLFQVVFYARLGEESGRFDFDAIADAISTKLIRRHPHVFGDAEVRDSAEQTREWERLKAQERRGRAQGGVLDGVSRALPALTRAVKLTRRAARAGHDWPDIYTMLDKVEEELDKVHEEVARDADPERLSTDIGELLFRCASLARHAGIDPETALRGANARFEKKF